MHSARFSRVGLRPPHEPPHTLCSCVLDSLYLITTPALPTNPCPGMEFAALLNSRSDRASHRYGSRTIFSWTGASTEALRIARARSRAGPRCPLSVRSPRRCVWERSLCATTFATRRCWQRWQRRWTGFQVDELMLDWGPGGTSPNTRRPAFRSILPVHASDESVRQPRSSVGYWPARS